MKRMLLAGLLAVAPVTAAAAPLPYVNCLPAENAPVCLDQKPMSLLGSNLQCELCMSPVAPPRSVDQGKTMAAFCDALRMMSGLSPCDQLRSDMATTNRTTM